MDKSKLTLSNVFAIGEKEMAKRKARDLEVLSVISSIRKKIANDAKEIRWPAALEEVVGNIASLLDTTVGDIIVFAWNKYRVLARYLDREKYPPSDTFLVSLAEHTIHSKHRPHLDVFLDDQRIGRIDFEVDLSLILKGFIAKVKDGRIFEIKAGTCSAKGTFKCENLLLVEKESESLTLPGKIVFADGVPIE
jgi:hypothetical protein